MSNNVNTRLFERAAEVCTYFEGTDIELAIDNLIKNNDLDQLYYLVNECEAEMSRQEFYNYDLIAEREQTDVF